MEVDHENGTDDDVPKSERHLKCDDQSPTCRRCQQASLTCVRKKLNLKFRAGSSAKYDTTFTKDQQWAKPVAGDRNFEYVDETGVVVAQFSEAIDDETPTTPSSPSKKQFTPLTPWSETLQSTHAVPEGQGHFRSYSAPTASDFTEPIQSGDFTSAPLKYLQQDNALLRAALLRYFIDRLARSFDLCDPEKHFELVVPQRARSCQPLMNAILATSARHIMTVSRKNNMLTYKSFPGLNDEVALDLHSECIKDLMSLTSDQAETQNEDLLAAAIILRFHEEVDAPQREDTEDSELFLHVTNQFLNGQYPFTPHIPHSSPLITHSGLANDHEIAQSSLMLPETLRPSQPGGLRQAAFWVAFRQEIYASFLKQRPFSIPLSHCEGFRRVTPAEDAVWADRMVVFCADVLVYCYGGVDSSPSQDQAHWEHLKSLESSWTEITPTSFTPIYHKHPNANLGEVLPEIWYLSDCHVTGIQHLELARMLLAMHNPSHQRSGPGAFTRAKALGKELRAIVLRLCGIALGNKGMDPAAVTASLGIALCGDYFEDRADQNAVLGVLEEVNRSHGWNVSRTIESLKQAWDW